MTTSEYKPTPDEVCAARRDVINERFASLDKALGLATLTMERRLGEMNEFRAEAVRDKADFVKVGEYHIKMTQHDDFIRSAREQLTTLMISYNDRMTSMKWVSFGSFLIALAALVLVVISMRIG